MKKEKIKEIIKMLQDNRNMWQTISNETQEQVIELQRELKNLQKEHSNLVNILNEKNNQIADLKKIIGRKFT